MIIETFVTHGMQENCYVVSQGISTVIIDPGSDDPYFCEAVINYIENAELNVRAVILTHTHFDHIAGADIFAERYSVPIYVHADDEEGLINDAVNLASSLLSGNVIITSPHICIIDGDTVYLDDMHIKFIHTPGHTRGSMCIDFGTFLFTGDTLFEGSAGRTDLPGGNYAELLNSLKKLNNIYGNKDIRIYPGHGPDTLLSTEITTNFFYRRLRNELQ